MTFGTPIVAPDSGTFRELLTNTRNSLYQAGSANALCKALTTQSEKSTDEVRAANQAIAADWGWETVVREIILQAGAHCVDAD